MRMMARRMGRIVTPVTSVTGSQ